MRPSHNVSNDKYAQNVEKSHRSDVLEIDGCKMDVTKIFSISAPSARSSDRASREVMWKVKGDPATAVRSPAPPT